MKKRVITDRAYYWIMILPAIILIFMFHTMAWPGVLVAFKDYVPVLGILKSEWVGLRNFEIFFKQPDCGRIIRNTLVIAVGKIVGVQISSIVFALMLNEVRNSRLKRFIQTITYLPHFVSWVVFSAVLKAILGGTGLFNTWLTNAGKDNIMFLGIPSIFPAILILSDVIKEFGWGSIMYLAALTSINPELYEASEIDGATRWKQTIHVTLPGIRHIVILNGVLSLGSILSAGFDIVYNMYNPLVYSTGDVIETWVFRQGLINLNYGVGTAVGLFSSLISLSLIVLSWWLADKFADYRIF